MSQISVKKKWPKNLPVLLAACVGLVCLLLCFKTSEPTYEGKRLTSWMSQYEKHLVGRSEIDKSERDAAHQAIRHIGTNALPTLLRMVAAKDSKMKLKLIALFRKQRLIQIPFANADTYHARATYGFGALREIAKPAVPELIRLLSDPDRDVCASAAQCLSLIGPEAKDAVPALVDILNDNTNRYGPILMNSMLALGCIRSKPETVVPVLLEYVSGPRKDWNYVAPALDALALYRDQATSAVPAILPVLNSADESHRNSASRALRRIEGASKSK